MIKNCERLDQWIITQLMGNSDFANLLNSASKGKLSVVGENVRKWRSTTAPRKEIRHLIEKATVGKIKASDWPIKYHCGSWK